MIVPFVVQERFLLTSLLTDGDVYCSLLVQDLWCFLARYLGGCGYCVAMGGASYHVAVIICTDGEAVYCVTII